MCSPSPTPTWSCFAGTCTLDACILIAFTWASCSASAKPPSFCACCSAASLSCRPWASCLAACCCDVISCLISCGTPNRSRGVLQKRTSIRRSTSPRGCTPTSSWSWLLPFCACCRPPRRLWNSFCTSLRCSATSRLTSCIQQRRARAQLPLSVRKARAWSRANAHTSTCSCNRCSVALVALSASAREREREHGVKFLLSLRVKQEWWRERRQRVAPRAYLLAPRLEA